MKQILLISLILATILLSACAAPATTPATTPTPTPTPAPSEQPATSPTLALLKTSLETFLTYNKFQQLDKMWPMLHPDIQDIYEDVDEFTQNMEMRPNLKGWIIGSPQIVSQWASKSTIDLVGTERSYSNVAEIPVTFIYSTTSGEIEQSQMMNAIVVNNDWKFFIRKIKAPTSESTITSTPSPTPTPPPTEPTPESKTDREDVIKIIKANASAKWGDDYQMVNYEVSNQTKAYDWVVEQTAYPDIMERAKSKWQNDYEMVQYEYGNQVEDYEWIMRQTAYPDIMERAKQKWGGDYEMVRYEYENQVEAYKALQ